MAFKVEFDTSKLDKTLDDMLEKIKKVQSHAIEIGVLVNDSEIQMIAHVHEYGATINVTPKMRAWFAYQGYPLKASTTVIKIPERSYMRSGIKNNKKEIVQKTGKLLPDVILHGVDEEKFLQSIGDEFAGLIQKNLRDLKTPPNSGMTKERKKSSNPLIDTGRLVGEIKARVVRK